MSFHEDMFHETKRDRKYYEKKKQRALQFIDRAEEFFNFDPPNAKERGMDNIFRELRIVVNDI